MAESELNAEALLKTQDEVMTRTRGTSMRPLLRQGRDIVVIKRPRKRDMCQDCRRSAESYAHKRRQG